MRVDCTFILVLALVPSFIVTLNYPVRVIDILLLCHSNGLFDIYIPCVRLYWSDWKGDIRSFDKSARFSLPEIIAAGIKRPDDLQVYGGTAVKKGIWIYFISHVWMCRKL